MREIRIRKWCPETKTLVTSTIIGSPVTMLCTGLHDVNKERIFEGDLVIYHQVLYLIRWDEQFARFEAVTKTGYVLDLTRAEFHKYGEVIGNIYQQHYLWR